mmetsp:Transcript_11816/g.17232  ORF Transcript_11816/g.17232 Transcript_11816/m.17232 type:complete len:110 (+) Transcript_11816:410-739(+)
MPYNNDYLAGIFYCGLISKMKDPHNFLFGVGVCFFEAPDEDLKSRAVEAYWGPMIADGNIKEPIDQYWPSLDEDGNIITEDIKIKKEETETEVYDAAPIIVGNLRTASA